MGQGSVRIILCERWGSPKRCINGSYLRGCCPLVTVADPKVTVALDVVLDQSDEQSGAIRLVSYDASVAENFPIG